MSRVVHYVPGACQVPAEAREAADAKTQASGEAAGTPGCSLALACPHAYTPGQPAAIQLTCALTATCSDVPGEQFYSPVRLPNNSPVRL